VEFLHRMEQAARKGGEYVVERHPPVKRDEGSDLKLKPLIVTPHKGLTGWLRPAPDDGKRVLVGVEAATWSPEPLTYNIYVQAAHHVFQSVLQAYNRVYGTSRRLNIPSREETEPYLPEIARERFYEFVGLADKKGLDNEDWSRLYGFIWHCTTYNVELSLRDLDRLLRLSGFDDAHARQVATIFTEGRTMLLHKWRGKKPDDTEEV
ncbi:MAG: hypothetical protein KAU50_12245, partial [Candidatus Marinimicrobia bacterium]|nr:hypothetical protein [Candidatus Neomarinimicrobiota bacterium]